MGVNSPAGLTKPGRCQRRDQTKPNTWYSRLGVGRGANIHNPYKRTSLRKLYDNYHTRGPMVELSQTSGSMTTSAQGHEPVEERWCSLMSHWGRG